jgi:hypothetical protein
VRLLEELRSINRQRQAKKWKIKLSSVPTSNSRQSHLPQWPAYLSSPIANNREGKQKSLLSFPKVLVVPAAIVARIPKSRVTHRPSSEAQVYGRGGGVGRGRRVGRGLGVTLGVEVGLTLGEGLVVGTGVAVGVAVGVGVGVGG